MAKYLDETGLGTAWSNMKTWVGNQGYTSNAGTVTSVSAQITGTSLNEPFPISVSVSNSTTTPTISIARPTLTTLNAVYASPASGSGVPTFRALVLADMPTAVVNVATAYSNSTLADTALTTTEINAICV